MCKDRVFSDKENNVSIQCLYACSSTLDLYWKKSNISPLQSSIKILRSKFLAYKHNIYYVTISILALPKFAFPFLDFIKC